MELIERAEMKDIKYLKSLSIKDFVDAGALNKCKTKKEQKEQYDRIQGYLSRMQKCRGEMKHIYKHTLTSNMTLGGRLFSGTSIQGITYMVRGMLFGKQTTDFDCQNCHPKILRWLCKRHEIPCPNLDYYCNNRDEVLGQGDRDTNKIAILKMVNDDKPNRGLRGFLKELDKECKKIQQTITKIDDYKDLLNTIPAHRVYNWYGSAINRILCKYENEIIQEVLHIVNTKNIEVCSLMFDGLMIYGDYYEDRELINDVENRLAEKFKGLDMKMTYKGHDFSLAVPDDWKEPEDFLTEEQFIKKNKLSEGEYNYDDLKNHFENEMGACKILKKSMFLLTIDAIFETKDDLEGDVAIQGDYILTMTEPQLKTSFKHFSYKESENIGSKDEPHYIWVDKPFLNRWLFDNKIKTYVDIGVYPPPLKCPKHIYNLWEDWQITRYSEYEERPEELGELLNHIKILCGNHEETYEYMLKWIAQMLQFPATKTICPTIISQQGGGKGTLMKLLRLIMGVRKVIETTNPSRDCWGDFNSMMQSSFLVNLNELSMKDTLSAEGKIKGYITDDTMFINKKNTPQHIIRSFHRFIITTNNEEPIKTSKDDRRNLIIRASDEKCGDKSYFNKLYGHMKDRNVLMHAYMHFMNEEKYDVKNFNNLPLPKTPYQKELEKINISPIEAFIKRKAEKNMGKKWENDEGVSTYTEKISMKELYKKFICWKTSNNFEYSCNDAKFAVRLWRLNIDGLFKGRHCREGNMVDLNYKKINKVYLEDEIFDEYYNPQLNSGTCHINLNGMNHQNEDLDNETDSDED
mgnify:FL=1